MQADYSQLRDEEKADFWKEQIESWMDTGLTQAQFCRDHNLSKSRFNYWKRKLYPPSSSSDLNEIIKLPFKLESNIKSTFSFQVNLSGKYQILINGDFCAQVLKKLIHTLENMS